MGTANTTVLIAFIGGILSFISPCVLPLVPAYISYLGGRASQQISLELSVGAGGAAIVSKNRLGIFVHGVFFVFGLAMFFVTFGLITNATLHLVQGFGDIKVFLQKFGGVIAVLFGLHVLGATGWLLRISLTKVKWDSLGGFGAGVKRILEGIQGWLYADTRRQMNPRTPYGYLGSTAMGLVFAAGWSPCIGPIYGTILDVSYNATSGSSFLNAGILLMAYALGLGVPFLLAAIALDQMRGLMKRLQRRMRLIEVVSGLFLIAMGILLFTGQLSLISAAAARLNSNLEICLEGRANGDVPASDLDQCMALGLNYKQLSITPTATTPATISTALPVLTPIAPAINAIPVLTGTPVPQVANASEGLNVGDIAPDFTLNTLDGRSVSLKSLRGKVVLLNFWATWCKPCGEEMPIFQKFASSYDTKNFQVLAVDFLESSTAIKSYADKLGLTFNIGLDPKGTINRQFAVEEYPVSYIIDRNGIILARQAGAFPPGKLESALKQWVGVQSASQ